jgi:hypothetical protein
VTVDVATRTDIIMLTRHPAVAHSSLGFASIAAGRRRPIFETSPRSRARKRAGTQRPPNA